MPRVTKPETYAARQVAKKKREYQYLVEKESVGVTDIALRLGISPAAARKRLQRERGKPGPLTWAGLTYNPGRGHHP